MKTAQDDPLCSGDKTVCPNTPFDINNIYLHRSLPISSTLHFSLLRSFFTFRLFFQPPQDSLTMSDETAPISYDQYPQYSPYGYKPNAGAAIAFIAIFSVLAIAHIIQGWRYKYWIVYPTLVTGSIGMWSTPRELAWSDRQVKSLGGLDDIGRIGT